MISKILRICVFCTISLISMEKKTKHIIYPEVSMVIALYCDVENTKELREAVIGGQFDASLVKASLVMDEFLVTVAANKAVHSMQCGKMTTKTVHSEIIYNLFPGRKITEAFRKIGISNTDTSVVVVVVGKEDSVNDTFDKLTSLIRGKPTSLDQLHTLAHIDLIIQEYKLSEQEISTCSHVAAIASRIAAKDTISF